MARTRIAENPPPQQLSLDDWADTLAAERAGSAVSRRQAATAENRTESVRHATARRDIQEAVADKRDALRHDASEAEEWREMTERDKSSESSLKRATGGQSSRGVDPATSAANEERLLTTREAASLLRVHPRTVQRLVERGQLTAVRLGAAVRFDPNDVTGLISRVKHQPACAASDTRAPRRSSRALSAATSFRDRVRTGD